MTQPGSRSTEFIITDDLFKGVIYPDGARLTMTYAGRLLASITDPEGHVTAYTYDRVERVRTMTTPEGNTYTYTYLSEEAEYGEEDFWIEVTDPAGNVTTVIHDCNVVQGVIDPLGQRTTYVWEPIDDPRLLNIIDANDHETFLQYDRLDNGTRALSQLTRPDIHAFAFDYGADSRCHTITDFDGHKTYLSWDSGQNRKSVLDAKSKRFTFLYNDDFPSRIRFSADRPCQHHSAVSNHPAHGCRAEDIHRSGVQSIETLKSTGSGIRLVRPMVRVLRKVPQCTAAAQDIWNL